MQVPARSESAAFGLDDLIRFTRELREHERGHLVDRLRAASARLAELAPALEAAARERPVGEGGQWSALEVMGHIGVLSQFYGYLAAGIARGRIDAIDLLSMIQLRDQRNAEFASRPLAELIAETLDNHRRTLELLSTVPIDDLERRIPVAAGITMSAEEVIRLPLLSHLEAHLEQLAGALA